MVGASRLRVNVKPDFSDSSIQACYVLHNYIRKNDCLQLAEILCECRIESAQPVGKRSSVRGKENISQSILPRHKVKFAGSMLNVTFFFFLTVHLRIFLVGDQLCFSP